MKKLVLHCLIFLGINTAQAMEIPHPDDVGKQWEKDLETAINNQDFNELTKLLENQSDCETFTDVLNRAFIYASWRNTESVNIKMMSLFLNIHQVDINYIDTHFVSGTALLSVALKRHKKAVKFLLEQPHINVNTKISIEKEEKSALEWIKNIKNDGSFKYKEIIELLENASAKYDSINIIYDK